MDGGVGHRVYLLPVELAAPWRGHFFGPQDPPPSLARNLAQNPAQNLARNLAQNLPQDVAAESR